MLPQVGVDRLPLLGRPLPLGLFEQLEEPPRKTGRSTGHTRRQQPLPPAGKAGLDDRGRLGVGGSDLRVEVGDPGVVLRGRKLDQRRCYPDPAREILRCSVLGEPVEGIEEAVVVDLRERIVLVVVALAASERQAEPGGACRVDPVEEVVEPLLLGDRPPLAIEEVIAVEAAGYSLLDRRIGEEISGKLLG